MRIGKKQIFLMFLSGVVLTVSFLGGCKQEEPDNHTKDPHDNVLQQEDMSGLSKLFWDTKWKEEWKADTEGGSDRNLTIDADIIVPDLDEMSVIEVENLSFNNENKEMFLKGLFGDSDIYYNDDAFKSKEQWKKIIDSTIQQDIDFYSSYMETVEDKRDEKLYRETLLALQNMKADYEEKMKNAPTEYTKAENFDKDSYLGELNGQLYTVTFDKDEYQYRSYDESQINVYAVTKSRLEDEDFGSNGNGYGTKMNCFTVQNSDYDSMRPEELKDVLRVQTRNSSSVEHAENADEILKEKNRCEMSKKEAEAYAQRYLGMVGVPSAVCTDIGDLYWMGEERDDANHTFSQIYIPDGYQIKFTVGIDDVSLESFGTEETYKEASSMSGLKFNAYSMKTEVIMQISDKGLLSMTVYNPIQICNITSNVELLSLDNIYEIIRAEMTQNARDYGTNSTLRNSKLFNELELIYFRVANKEKENHYSYIPVWRLGVISTGQNYSGEQVKDIGKEVLVNAIDGSVIHLLDELLVDGEE